MLTAFFENAYFLQALGWAIVSSLWQVALLCLIYKSVTSLKVNSSALFKHNLSFILLMLSTVWFIYTTIQSYYDLKNSLSNIFSLSISQYVVSSINTVLPYLAVVYSMFFIFFLARFTGIFFKTTQLKKRDLIKPSIDIRVFVNNRVLHLGIKRKVQVWLSESIDVPSVIGFFKPFILLPAAAITQLNTQQLESILLHELAHIARQDLLLNMFQTVAKLMLFFNPFAAFLNKQIENERENCCDDWVINHQYNKETYANALVLIETYRQGQTVIALAATSGKKQLLNRIKRLFTTESNTILSRFQKIQIAILSFFILIFAIVLNPLNSTVSKNNFTSNKKITSTLLLRPLANMLPKNTIVLLPVKKIIIKENTKTSIMSNENNMVNKEQDYSVALINENLVQNKTANYTAQPVSNKEKINTPKYFVKIEEENSGNNYNNVYYFQLSQDSGKAAIEPIIFINKPAKDKSAAKKMPDTSAVPGKKVTT